MSSLWLEQRERGSLAVMKGGVRLLLSVGHAFGRLLLYPTCAYFLASSRQSRAASRDYLGRVLGRPARLLDVARHYLTFAKTLHDRVYFLAGRTAEFDIEQHGLDTVERTLAKGKGWCSSSAHLGSFEVLRVLGSLECKLPVNVLLYPDNASNADAVAGDLCPELKQRVASRSDDPTRSCGCTNAWSAARSSASSIAHSSPTGRCAAISSANPRPSRRGRCCSRRS